MSQRKARFKRKQNRETQISSRLKLFLDKNGYSLAGFPYQDILQSQRECFKDANDKFSTRTPKYQVKNFLIEISLYIFNSYYVSTANGIQLKMPKKRHKPPNSFMANFGIVSKGKQKNVEMRKIKWDHEKDKLSKKVEASFSQSDRDLFGNRTTYTDQFEKTFSEIEGKAAEVLSNFVIQDERKDLENSLDDILENDIDLRKFVAENIVKTTGILYSKLILALYFSMIQAKLWLPGDENSKKLQGYLYAQTIRKSMDLLSRKWIWLLAEEGEDIPFFDKILIEIPENNSIFISISRKIGLYICPVSQELGSIPFYYIPPDDVSLSHEFLDIVGFKINVYLRNNKNSAIYFSPLASRLATHPNVKLQ